MPISLEQLFYASGTEENRLVDYHVAMLSICFAILLGFADDVIDIKWRNKIVIGIVASLPLVMSYSGPTSIVVPHTLRPLLCTSIEGTANCALTPLGSLIDVFASVDTAALGGIIELKHLYKVYMVLLVVFCTNSVNIYAGINGLGSYVCSVCV
jgi:UDP-N-acetylglucosamine--dolichyl-phosphate N-acetylglucosaminephosphotransferase